MDHVGRTQADRAQADRKRQEPLRAMPPATTPQAAASRRTRACAALLRQVHTITAAEGPTPSALHAIKLKLVALARRAELFPAADFPPPLAEGRNHPLLVEDGDGLGLYLTIGLPGKEAAPHDHGIWCVNAAISGRERHVFYRRTDDGTVAGAASIVRVGEVIVEPGHGMAMADHDIHATEVLGDQPAIGLALYGYALARFPSVAWFHPQFGSARASPSRRPVAPQPAPTA
jgi:predicted metal-dependent enzyme (double-stranded beta helix superfamily)